LSFAGAGQFMTGLFFYAPLPDAENKQAGWIAACLFYN
jgi:hypothetical protein